MKSSFLKPKIVLFVGITTAIVVGVFVLFIVFYFSKPSFSTNTININGSSKTENAKLNSSDANQEAGHFNIFSILNKFITN